MIPDVYHIIPGNEQGGGATHIIALARAVRDSNLAERFHFFTVGEGALAVSLRLEGIIVGEIPRPPLQAVRTLYREMVRSDKQAIWHAHGPRMNLWTCLAASLSRRIWTSTVHSDIFGDFLSKAWKNRFLPQLNRRCLQHCAGLFTGNRTFLKTFPGKPGFFVPNALTTAQLPSSKTLYREQLRQQLGLSARTPVIGTVARLDPVKDLTTLLRAVVYLPEVHLVLVGDGPDRLMLKTLSEELGIAARTHFFGFLQDVGPIYAGLDVHVLPSRSEGGSPYALLEAGFYGAANVGSDVPGIRSLLEDEVTGLLFTQGDPPSLAAAVQRLLVDIDLRQRVIREFNHRILPKYTPAAMLAAYVQGYEQLVKLIRSKNHG